jgi:type IV pilus assembly protein PilM
MSLKLPEWARLPAWLTGGVSGRKPAWSWLEPKYPPVAFDLDPRNLSMVRVGQRKGQRKKEAFIASFDVEAIPPDIMEIDFLHARLTAPERFRSLLGKVIEKEPTKFNRVSLLLPDNYARVAIIPFEEIPRSRRDAVELIRWKTKKSVPFRVEDAAVDYQVLDSDRTGLSVLAVLIPRAIVEEFESVFASLGIHAGLVELNTFSLINLCRPLLAEGSKDQELLLANVTGTYFSFVIFRAGRIAFFRSKALAAGGNGDASEAAVRLLRREIQTSLVYYREKLEGRGLSRVYLRVVDLDAGAVAGIFSNEPGLGTLEMVNPRRVVSANGRFEGERGETLLQRLAPAIGAAARRVIA